jgi:outer membrane biosynthesis protein TonB
MRNAFHCIGALTLVSALSACGGREEAANNAAAANEMNVLMAESAPLANTEVEAPAAPAPAVREEAPVAKAAPAKPAPAPAPAKPKPADPPEKTPDPSCTPEHRAAGHC